MLPDKECILLSETHLALWITPSYVQKMDELEGPQLAGLTREAIMSTFPSCASKFLAIGGIDESNCDIPVTAGADGVGVIRSVLKAADPSAVALQLHQKMIQAMMCWRLGPPSQDTAKIRPKVNERWQEDYTESAAGNSSDDVFGYFVSVLSFPFSVFRAGKSRENVMRRILKWERWKEEKTGTITYLQSGCVC